MPETAAQRSQVLMRRVLGNFRAKGRRLGLPFSFGFGLAEMGDETRTPENLFEAADRALLLMKRRARPNYLDDNMPGRNKIEKLYAQ